MLTYLYVHLLWETQVSRLGTGSFISMIPILIATSITCADINDLVDRAKNYPDITEEHRQEVIDLYDDVVMDLGLECRDAKAD